MHYHDVVTHVLRGNESRGHFDERQHAHGNETGVNDQRDCGRAKDSPDSAGISIARALEHAVEAAEKPAQQRVEYARETVFGSTMLRQ